MSLTEAVSQSEYLTVAVFTPVIRNEMGRDEKSAVPIIAAATSAE